MDCPRMRPPAQRRAARCTLTMRRIAALAITFAAVVVLAGVPASAADSSDSEPERPAEGSRRGEGGGVGAGGGGERGGVEMPVSSPRSAAPKGNGDMQKRGGLKGYLEKRGMKIEDLPLCLVLYESISMLLLFGIGAGMYVLEPTKRGLFRPLRALVALGGSGFADTVSARFASAEAKAELKLAWLSRRLNLSPVRLATAYAEGVIVRIAARPVLVPFKLFVTYKFLKRIGSIKWFNIFRK
ncbi:hypothetical protein T484DRAFT_1967156 [Baffinella frigidus]|nr:hypothetical protein T484DRAFT_1967156 [Cryptophyta sp. CCMP2293]